MQIIDISPPFGRKWV